MIWFCKLGTCLRIQTVTKYDRRFWTVDFGPKKPLIAGHLWFEFSKCRMTETLTTDIYEAQWLWFFHTRADFLGGGLVGM